jgi:acyl-CoA synthetase (NDP forming)
LARSRGIDVGYWITTGNECDLELGECLLWAARQDDVDVILAYAEGVRDGPVLREAFVAAKAAGKAVLFLKAGRSAAGSAAVATHTAALTGADAVYDAMFRQHGVARVGTTEEMVDAAVMCGRGIAPIHRRTALVTISGAMGVQMADAAEAAGLDVAPLPEEAQARLKALTPVASPRNPVDITAQAFNDLGLVERNLRRAQARLEHAEEQVRKCRSWIARLPKLIEESYTPHGHRLQLFLEGDLTRGMAVLDRRIDALERYAGLKADYTSGPSSGPAPTPEGS